MPSVVIIGGGISGLSTAYYLSRAGISSRILEARPRLGGVIETHRVAGCVVEGGPDSFLSVKPAAMELITELGMAQHVIGSNDHLRKTYVRKGGRLVPLPDGLLMMIPTKVLPLVTTSLLSWPTKVRMGLELLRAPGHRERDRSVADFVAEHYGQEAVDYLAEPLLSGIYGGDPEALSVTSVLPRFVELETRYGSLSKGVLAERRNAKHESGSLPLFRTLRGGLGELVDALLRAIAGKAELIHGRAEQVDKVPGGFRVRAGAEWIEAERLVLACEAHNASVLARPLDERLAALLASIPYSSSMTVALGFPASAFPRPLDGFGFLVPRRERRRLVACTWVGTKFSHRVPDGIVLLRCFLGGMNGSDIMTEPDQDALASVLHELQEIVGFRGELLFSRIFRWPSSMAQYTVGHAARIAETEARLASVPGLHLVGNAYHGIGIPDCIRMGKQAAHRIAAVL